MNRLVQKALAIAESVELIALFDDWDGDYIAAYDGHPHPPYLDRSLVVGPSSAEADCHLDLGSKVHAVPWRSVKRLMMLLSGAGISIKHHPFAHELNRRYPEYLFTISLVRGKYRVAVGPSGSTAPTLVEHGAFQATTLGEALDQAGEWIGHAAPKRWCTIDFETADRVARPKVRSSRCGSASHAVLRLRMVGHVTGWHQAVTEVRKHWPDARVTQLYYQSSRDAGERSLEGPYSPYTNPEACQ